MHHVQQLKGQCEGSTMCGREVAGGSLTQRQKGPFTVSWPKQIGE